MEFAYNGRSAVQIRHCKLIGGFICANILKLVSKALAFLTSVVKVQKHAHLFGSENVLQQVVEKVVLPNMSLRTADEELFEDDPIEFVRRDLEGSDSDTRRRSAADFLRAIMEQFEKLVTNVVSRYISHFLEDYSSDRKGKWKSKDTALYLFISIAAKGVLSSVGVTSTNILVDVVEFFDTNIFPDLSGNGEGLHPLVKVDAIKYVYTFRNQLRREQILRCLPLLTNFLSDSNFVVYTYAAITIERILTTRRNNQSMFSKADLAPYEQKILYDLFVCIEKGGATPEKVSENEYLMRCVCF